MTPNKSRGRVKTPGQGQVEGWAGGSFIVSELIG